MPEDVPTSATARKDAPCPASARAAPPSVKQDGAGAGGGGACGAAAAGRRWGREHVECGGGPLASARRDQAVWCTTFTGRGQDIVYGGSQPWDGGRQTRHGAALWGDDHQDVAAAEKEEGAAKAPAPPAKALEFPDV